MSVFANQRTRLSRGVARLGVPVLLIQNPNGGDRWYYSLFSCHLRSIVKQEIFCLLGLLLLDLTEITAPGASFTHHIWKVIPNTRLDSALALHLLNQISARSKAAARGATMVHMTKGGMESWMVEIPSLTKQRRIAGDPGQDRRAARQAPRCDCRTGHAHPASSLTGSAASRQIRKGGRQLRLALLRLTCAVAHH